MTSRERMLAALNCEKPDQVPCAIWMPAPEGREFKGWFEHMDWRLEQGVDVVCRDEAVGLLNRSGANQTTDRST